MKKTFILLFLVTNLLTITLLYKTKEAINQEKLDIATKTYTKAYKTVYESTKKLSLVVFNGLAKMGNVSGILKEIRVDKKRKNTLRKELYNSLKDRYNFLKKLHAKQIHIHLPNNESFLRIHKPDKYGDNLSSIRQTVVYVNEQHKSIDGFEIGRLYDGLRFVYPISENGVHLGSMEVSFSTEEIISNIMRQYSVLCNFAIKKSIIDSKVFETKKRYYKSSIFKNYYTEQKILPQLQKSSQKKILAAIESKDPSSIYDKELDKIFTIIPILNPITKQNIAFLLLTSTAQTHALNILEEYFYLILVLIIIFIAISFYTIYTITQRKIFVQKLLDSQENIFVLTDTRNRKVQEANQYFLDFFGFRNLYDFTQAHKCICEFFCKANDEKYIQEDEWHQRLLSHTDTRDLVQIRDSSNKKHIFKFNIKPFNTRLSLITFTDITKIKDYESNLEAMVKEKTDENLEQKEILYRQNRLTSIGETIVNIAHQWRQPLNSVGANISKLEMLNEKEFHNKDIQKIADESHKSLEYMSKTVDDFSNYFSSNKAKEMFCVNDVLNEAINILKTQLNSLNIKMELSSKRDKLHIFGHRNELMQVLIILINNAKDAILLKNEKDKFEGLINIDLNTNDKEIIISVKDNGTGIKEDIIDKIFEPYFTTKFKSNGTGIGLYMSKMIIEKDMGGVIEVLSSDTGAIFRCKLIKKER